MCLNALAQVEEVACCGKEEQERQRKARGAGIDTDDAGITQMKRCGNGPQGKQQERREVKPEFPELLCFQNVHLQSEGLGDGGKEHD